MTEVFSPTVIQEERSAYVLLLLAILVLMLHVYGIAWLREPPMPVNTSSPQPFKLEVSMLSVPSPTSSSSAVAKPSPKQPSDEPKKTPKETKHEKSLKAPTTPQIAQALNKKKPQDIEEGGSPPKPQVVKSQSTLQTQQTVSSAMIQNPSKQSHAKDNFVADELHNPSPEYPEMAVFLGYQGNAYVRIHVSAKGLSERVDILKSSGHKILDESAAEALKNWRFIPSKQGETPVADTVIISVVFTLR
jgi:protein TonB